MSFTFKQFHVYDENCAMKVGTDAVLLGSWLPDDRLSLASHAVDVGAGSGIISLMLLQRNPSLTLTAVELDAAAAHDCEVNFRNSPWEDRAHVVNADFRDYKPARTVDLIVCNPPYFARSLKCPGQGRTVARHQQGLSYHTLFPVVREWSGAHTAVALVSPEDQLDDIIFEGTLYGFHPRRVCRVHPRVNTPPNRVLVLFSRTSGPCVYENLAIRCEDTPTLTSHFQKLTESFYL